MPVEPEPKRDSSGADALTPYEASLDRRKPGMLGRLRDAQEEVRVGLEALADGTASITTRMGLDFITPDAGFKAGADQTGTEVVRDLNQAVVIITTERVSGEMVGDAVLDAANIEVDAGQAHSSIDDHSET